MSHVIWRAAGQVVSQCLITPDSLTLQVLFVADTRQTGIPAVTFTQGHGLDGPWGMVAGRTLKEIRVPDYI